MDIKIAGSGTVSPGEYETISLAGSAKLHGQVKCTTFSASGSAHGDEIECTGSFKASGSCKFNGEVKAGSISASGSFSCGKALVTGDIKCSGSAKFGGGIKCGRLKCSGAARCDGGIEAETVTAAGVLNCTGLLNAESIKLDFTNNMTIGSIGCGELKIKYHEEATFISRMVRILTGRISYSKVSIPGGIEGDSIEIEYTETPTVSGRNVKIGDGCVIDCVQYSESIEISSKAIVNRQEKL